mgnify:CR=1 FL=1|jgi:hypothetical protein
MKEFLLDKMPETVPQINDQIESDDLIKRDPGIGQIVLFSVVDGDLTNGN